MTYVDGYVIPIKKKNVPAYRRLASKAGKLWKKYGALEFFECVGDDLKFKPGMGKTFTRLARARPGETVLFSFAVYRNKAHRNKVNAKIMKDPWIASMGAKEMPFDMKRMAFGGFKAIVEY